MFLIVLIRRNVIVLRQFIFVFLYSGMTEIIIIETIFLYCVKLARAIVTK